MSDDAIRQQISDIHIMTARLCERREADTKEVAELKSFVRRLESRVWWALAGVAGAFGASLLSLLLS